MADAMLHAGMSREDKLRVLRGLRQPRPHTEATLLRIAESVAAKVKAKDEAGENPLAPLTDRELEVVCMVADGLSDRGIARRLDVQTRTVETHIASAAHKLGPKWQAIPRPRARLTCWYMSVILLPAVDRLSAAAALLPPAGEVAAAA
jgi:DNA-binding NarL/FixJ family response regulator